MSKNAPLPIVSAAVAACSLGACADTDTAIIGRFVNEVSVAASDEADFDSYQTFAIPERDSIPEENLEGVDDVDEVRLERVNEAAAEELREIGLVQVERDENPDLLLFSLASIEQEPGVVWDCVPGFFNGFFVTRFDPCRFVEPDAVRVDVRTLVTGLSDPDREEVVFVGFLQGIEDLDIEPPNVIENLVEEVYEEYPGEPRAPDAGMPDAGMPDAGMPDAGTPDAGTPDAESA